MGVKCVVVGIPYKEFRIVSDLIRYRGNAQAERYHGFYQDVKVGRIGPNDVKNVPRCIGERRLRTLPSFSDTMSDLSLFWIEGGEPRRLLLLVWRSRGVGNKFWTNGSSYVVPSAVDSP